MADNHGNTPAAWTAVVIGLAAFVVGGIGLMVSSMPVFWVGVALAPVALVTLYVMAKMGLHSSSH
ncbi:MAG: HGxxPAAW family protein [Marmoricola sp.]